MTLLFGAGLTSLFPSSTQSVEDWPFSLSVRKHTWSDPHRNRWLDGQACLHHSRRSRLSSGTMGSNQSKPHTLPSSITPMSTKQTRKRIIPDLQFRVLVLGRANAGKTSILQRVCETTESPTIYRGGKKVRGPNLCPQVGFHCRVPTRTNLIPCLTRQWTLVIISTALRLPLNMVSARRARHP